MDHHHCLSGCELRNWVWPKRSSASVIRGVVSDTFIRAGMDSRAHSSEVQRISVEFVKLEKSLEVIFQII